MYFSWHFTISLVFAIPLSIYVSPVFAIIFFLASVGIDFDHYLFYTLKLGKVNPKEMLDEWHTLIKAKKDPSILIFHNIEFILALVLASYFLTSFSLILYPITFGVFVHYTSDKIWDLGTKEHLNKRYWSITLWAIFKARNNGGPAGV